MVVPLNDAGLAIDCHFITVETFEGTGLVEAVSAQSWTVAVLNAITTSKAIMIDDFI